MIQQLIYAMNIDEEFDCNLMNIYDLLNSSPGIQVMAIRSGIAAIEADNLANNCGLAHGRWLIYLT
jgi:hypothetical protein